MNKSKLMALSIEELFKKLPKEYYVCQKCLWCGDNRVDIGHIDNDLDKPLHYRAAAIKMLEKLEQESSTQDTNKKVKRNESKKTISLIIAAPRL
jgi:hypothetical protein